jgi:hypothetical protein
MIHVSTRTNHSVASFAFVAHRESCSQVPGTRPKFEEPRLSEVRSQHFLRQRLSCLRRSLQLPHLSFKVQLITIYRSFKLFEFQFDKIAPFQETHHLTYVPTRTTQSSPPPPLQTKTLLHIAVKGLEFLLFMQYSPPIAGLQTRARVMRKPISTSPSGGLRTNPVVGTSSS